MSELLARFTDPAPEFGPLPMWWWSGAPVTSERVRWQLEQLVSQGVRQALVICLAPAGPMYGSLADDPPFLSVDWLRLLERACADAHELGCTLWLYDQIGFSGANVQGQLIAENPDFAGQALHRTRRRIEDDGELVLRVPAGHTALAGFAETDAGERVAVPVSDGAVRWTGGPAEVTLAHAGPAGFDYFDGAACAALLDRVHGRLERAVGHWFGTAIGGFFQDELPPMPTWGARFAETFAAEHGYDPLPELWALWADRDTGAHAARVRRDYHAHRALLARRAFFDQQRDWFARHGLTCGFDQASPAREGDPVGGVRTYGDYLGTHAGYGAPGSDHWGDAKVHSSLAHANGHARTWIEAFHSSGWGGSLEETYDWLAPFLRRGANLYDPHAVYYATPGGWWEWAPPSTCWRQPYWPSYHVFARAVARLCSVLTSGVHVCDAVLLSPTSTAQAYLSLDGPLAPARASADCFHQLNGVGSWVQERRGVLERAGIDHDVLDEATVAAATVDGGGLRVGDEAYRTVLLPRTRALTVEAADVLLRLAAAGGRVVCVGIAPEVFLGDTDGETAAAFAEAVTAGRITVARTAGDAPAAVATGRVRVSADAPFLLRRVGDTHVLAVIAHDERTGTAAPIAPLPDQDWVDTGFRFDRYWARLRATGYRFVPAGRRRARVGLTGLPDGLRAQRWDPRTGRRTELTVAGGPDGGHRLDVSFEDGPVTLLVLGPDLPDPTDEPLGPPTRTVPVPGPWRARAESTLDNRWGDVGAAARTGTLPVEVWRFEHRAADAPDRAHWLPVVAGFGPFALARGPGEAEWTETCWSLSRGLRDDPAHVDTLGPKGFVPEEFLDWRQVPAGERVAVRTRLAIPDRPGLHLVIGANAARRVLLDGTPLAPAPPDGAPPDGAGEGYQSFHPLPPHARGRTVTLEIQLTAEVDGPVRASFALVNDVAAYRRPEWLTAGSAGPSVELVLDRPPADGRVWVASDGPCNVLVNGVEVGRQGGFSPYPWPEIRVHPYDLAAHLRTGANTITLRAAAAALDSVPAAAGGLGLVSGPGWTASADDTPVRMRRTGGGDPRIRCGWVRPHPLPGAHWLEPASAPDAVVEPVLPNPYDRRERTEWLRFAAPLGTTAVRVPTSLRATAVIAGQEYPVPVGWLRLPGPLPAATPVLLRFEAVDGRRGGALLDAAVEVRVDEVEAPLLAWEELGLRSLGGLVTYRTTVHHTPGDRPERAVLDLGDVRGTADVLVNGALVDRLVWGPWACEVTDALRPGVNELDVVVRGTLAGYLDDASPTWAVAAGQVRTGLFGPVRLAYFGAEGSPAPAGVTPPASVPT